MGLWDIIRSLTLRKARQSKGGSKSLDSLYCTLSYTFQDEQLIRRALTHRSYSQLEENDVNSYERLEFLGDAVLGLVVTDELFRRYPDKSEGELTRAKSYLVSRDSLAQCALAMDLGQYLVLGAGEERTGGRQRESILADAYEAMLGALYLEGGLHEVRRLVKRDLLDDLSWILASRFYGNYKSWLLEHVQKDGNGSPVYRVLKEKGPDHKKEFTVEVRVAGQILGKGKGLSKKRAEQEAALQAIRTLGLKS